MWPPTAFFGSLSFAKLLPARHLSYLGTSLRYPLQTMWPPTAFFRSLSIAKRLPARHLSYLGTSLCYPLQTMWPPTAFFRSLSFAKLLPARRSFIFVIRKTPTVPNGTAHAARLVSAGQFAEVHCRATEQFHARVCLFCKIS